MKKITVVTGHYGSGKTNFSVNLALRSAKEGKKTSVVDLDIVNPYFRLADFGALFAEHQITMAAPQFANTSLDIPALNFSAEVLAAESDHLIIDVGGDDAGAVALGRYSRSLFELGAEVEMLYVINRYRYLSDAAAETTELIRYIEDASRMKHTGIVNNSNLGAETTAQHILDSLSYAEQVSRAAGLPVVYTTYPDSLAMTLENGFPVSIFVKPVWER